MGLREFQVLQGNLNTCRVRLTPSAISFGPVGPTESDHMWLLTRSEDAKVRMHNTATGHYKDIQASDVICAWIDDRAPADGLRHLEVVLRRRLGLQGCRARWLPDVE